MGHRRAGLGLALLLAAGVAVAATQGPPVYTYTGTAPSGSCTGTRVLIDAGGTGTYFCDGGTWALVSSGTGSGAPTTAQYWVAAADAGLSAEKDLSGFTGLVLNTAGTPSSKAANSCTNQFPRSDNASGVWTCATIGAADLPAASTTLGAVKHAANCAAGNHVNGIGAGGELSCSADSGGAPSFSGLTAGGVMYANSTTTIVSTGTGTSGRSTLISGGTGAPTWVQGVRGVTMTQDRTINATTAASTTDLTWAINANEGQTFTCALTSTSTATSKIRYAVAGPASMTYMNCRVILGTTSLTTLVANTIQGQWATTCTNCTNSVTASVLTTKITDTLECSVTNGANAGNITIYFADSTAGQVNTLHKGSGCLVTGGG